jgi:hypothetical protein
LERLDDDGAGVDGRGRRLGDQPGVRGTKEPGRQQSCPHAPIVPDAPDERENANPPPAFVAAGMRLSRS